MSKKRTVVTVTLLAVLLFLTFGGLLLTVVGCTVFVSNVSKQDIQDSIENVKNEKTDYLDELKDIDQSNDVFEKDVVSSLDHDEDFLKNSSYVPEDIEEIYKDRISLNKKALFLSKSSRIIFKAIKPIAVLVFDIILTVLNLILKLYEIF